MFMVIVYDIEKNSKRSKVAKILEQYGNRVQKSVFECHLTDRESNELKKIFLGMSFDTSDSIRFYSLEADSLKKIEKIGGVDFNINKNFYLA